MDGWAEIPPWRYPPDIIPSHENGFVPVFTFSLWVMSGGYYQFTRDYLIRVDERPAKRISSTTRRHLE